MRSIGDDYVKSEFRRHQNCEPHYINPFMREWTAYRDTLAQQLEKDKLVMGQKIDSSRLDNFSDEQLGQLHALKSEIKDLTSSGKR